MPKRTFKTVRQSEDEILAAREAELREARQKAKPRPLTEDQIRVHLDTGPLDFPDEDDDSVGNIEIEESSEEEKEEGDVVEIVEIELPPALVEKVGTYLLPFIIYFYRQSL